MEMIKPDTFSNQAFLSIEPVLSMFDKDERYEKLGHIAAAIGSTRRTIYRWQTEGLPISTAEKIADNIGLHPTLIWGPEYHTAIYYEQLRIEHRDELRAEKFRQNSKRRYWANKEKISEQKQN